MTRRSLIFGRRGDRSRRIEWCRIWMRRNDLTKAVVNCVPSTSSYWYINADLCARILENDDHRYVVHRHGRHSLGCQDILLKLIFTHISPAKNIDFGHSAAMWDEKTSEVLIRSLGTLSWTLSWIEILTGLHEIDSLAIDQVDPLRLLFAFPNNRQDIDRKILRLRSVRPGGLFFSLKSLLFYQSRRMNTSTRSFLAAVEEMNMENLLILNQVYPYPQSFNSTEYDHLLLSNVFQLLSSVFWPIIVSFICIILFNEVSLDLFCTFASNQRWTDLWTSLSRSWWSSWACLVSPSLVAIQSNDRNSTLVNWKCKRSFPKSKRKEEKSIFALLTEENLTLPIPLIIPTLINVCSSQMRELMEMTESEFDIEHVQQPIRRACETIFQTILFSKKSFLLEDKDDPFLSRFQCVVSATMGCLTLGSTEQKTETHSRTTTTRRGTFCSLDGTIRYFISLMNVGSRWKHWTRKCFDHLYRCLLIICDVSSQTLSIMLSSTALFCSWPFRLSSEHIVKHQLRTTTKTEEQARCVLDPFLGGNDREDYHRRDRMNRQVSCSTKTENGIRHRPSLPVPLTFVPFHRADELSSRLSILTSGSTYSLESLLNSAHVGRERKDESSPVPSWVCESLDRWQQYRMSIDVVSLKILRCFFLIFSLEVGDRLPLQICQISGTRCAHRWRRDLSLHSTGHWSFVIRNGTSSSLSKSSESSNDRREIGHDLFFFRFQTILECPMKNQRSDGTFPRISHKHRKTFFLDIQQRQLMNRVEWRDECRRVRQADRCHIPDESEEEIDANQSWKWKWSPSCVAGNFLVDGIYSEWLTHVVHWEEYSCSIKFIENPMKNLDWQSGSCSFLRHWYGTVLRENVLSQRMFDKDKE